MSDADLLTIHTDGAARGNPGPAAFAYVITWPGHAPVEDHGVLEPTTNNIAEYMALINGLQRARELGGRRILVKSDSELMVKQMLGEYKVKNEGLRPLYEQARRLTKGFDAVSFQHVRREQNKRADELCNIALDGGEKRPRPKAAARSEALVPRKPAQLSPRVREEVLECLRSVACAWSAGNPNVPRPEEVWEQLWSILDEAGVLKK